MDNNLIALADLLFPEEAPNQIDASDSSLFWPTEMYEAGYPPRNLRSGAMVTRLGPSPTGFVHLGNLFMALVNKKLAEQSGGVFLLRIEDTDQKREVEGAVPALLQSLAYFGISFDEGAGLAAEHGKYGPYYQSARRAIYRAHVRKLVLEGKAYPCFLAPEQLEAIRKKQSEAKELPGVYGDYAKWRSADIALVRELIDAGEPYVIRLNADSIDAPDEGKTFTITDGIRGNITMPKNIVDVVILKTDGLPTYHFAHVVDDHLMRTTHVVRGEEWLSSLPIHIALFRALGFEPPVYCHTALMMKLDNGVKRKLSKREDPEFALSYYIADGYHPLAVQEYLLTVINSNFEEWRMSTPDIDSSAFVLTTEKMGASGILFDLDKLQNISRDTLSRIPASELADFVLDWVKREKPDAFQLLSDNKAVLSAALDIGRSGDKPRKDLIYAAQIFGFVSYFFDPYFHMEEPLPDNITEEDAYTLLKGYLASYEHSDGREQWFDKIRSLSAENGYAPKPKDYKNNPDLYKGHVGDVSTVIRRALTGRRNSPDIYEIQQILGEQRVRARLGPGKRE